MLMYRLSFDRKAPFKYVILKFHFNYDFKFPLRFDLKLLFELPFQLGTQLRSSSYFLIFIHDMIRCILVSILGYILDRFDFWYFWGLKGRQNYIKKRCENLH